MTMIGIQTRTKIATGKIIMRKTIKYNSPLTPIRINLLITINIISMIILCKHAKRRQTKTK
jgi:hypothetical protein